jgi:hypothetical protein
VDIKINKEDKYIILLFYFPESKDSLVVAIGSNSTTLVIEYALAYILLEEVRKKNIK